MEYLDIAYRETPERTLCLDLRVPHSDEKPPLIVYIPMSGMRSCAKENAPLWILEHGFALASIECRVSSEAIAPAAAHDCKAAVRWLRAHASEYGYNGDAIGVWGSSAGGLLASLIATSGNAADLKEATEYSNVSDEVQAACDLCGAPHDLMYFAKPQVQSEFAGVTENLRLYLGGPVQERAELAKLVSPSTYISKQCPPILLIHGDEDTVVPVAETIEFHRLLLGFGIDAALKVLPGAGHGLPESLTKPHTLEFFQRTLQHKS